MQPGFWGPPTSTVDWCEANYAHSPFIAEFFNTLSSLAIVAAGVCGLWLHRRLLEARFLLCFASVALVGLGSMAFHGTLRFELQMADELPMLYTAIIMVYILLESGIPDAATGQRRPRFGVWFPIALGAHALLVTCLTALSRGALQFYLFHLSFGSLETASLLGVYLLERRHGTPRTRRLLGAGMASYLIAVVLWYLDLRFCPFLSQRLPALGAFNPQLHAVWHVLVSCGFYSLSLVTAHVRMARLGQRVELARRWGVVPVLRRV